MKRAEITAGFHWIYVMVSGAIILLFFIGIVVRQKSVSEKELSVVVLHKLDSIFTGASLSEQTVNIIDVPELELRFTCDDTGFSQYTAGPSGAPREIPTQPFFAPSYLKTSRIITWTLNFNMPFLVTNFLFIGSPSVTYYLVSGSSGTDLVQKLDIPTQFKFQQIMPSEKLSTLPSVPSRFVKLVFLDISPVALPYAIKSLPDENVRAVEIRGCQAEGCYSGTVTFYAKEGDVLLKKGSASFPVSFDDRNAALYAAIFSDDAASYTCNMKKAMTRLDILSGIYKERLTLLDSYYNKLNSKDAAYVCGFRNDPEHFTALGKTALKCLQAYDELCAATLYSAAAVLRQENIDMQNNNCPVIY